jgi:cysteinyl-tRNA synthetase
MRRILNHLGYSIHFVMNITDIDDKIIVRARQNHLLDEFKKANPTLTSALVKDVRKSWSAFLAKKKMDQFAPPAPAGEDVHEDAIWEEISRVNDDPKWRAQTLSKEPMFGLWFNALNESRQAIIAATMAVTAINGASPPTSSDDLLSASKDILSSSLDDSLKHTVSDHSIFRSLAATWETAYFDDMKRLNVLPPSQLTRVSEYVPEIVTFTEKIIQNGFAYDDGTGNVYFDTKAFDGADLSDGEKASYAKLAPWSKGNKELLAEGEGKWEHGDQ